MASFLDQIFGAKPQIADFTPIDLSAEQIKALQADLAAFPEIQQLGNEMQQMMLSQYEAAIPGFRDILAAGGKTTQTMLSQAESELKGQIPADVQAAVGRTAAYQSLMSGTAGSPMAGALTARDFGLTSLDLISQGANLAGAAGNAAQRWAALSGANMPAGMLITPEQQANLDLTQNLIKRNIQQQKFNVAAAPDPALQALNQWVEQVGGSVVASYLGGGMGGGKGSNYATTYNAGSYGAAPVDWGGNMSQGGYQPGGGGAPPATGYDPFNTSTYVPPPMTPETSAYGGYYGPGSSGYYGIQPNPFNSMGGLDLSSQYAYNSNFGGY